MREQLSLGRHAGLPNAILERAARESWAARIWAKDAGLWKDQPDHRKIIRNALGWLHVARDLRPRAAELSAFAAEVRDQGFRTACLLGMGGSSLCPEVCAETFGSRPGFLELVVLDTTDPAHVLNAERRMHLEQTLFIVASKSGDTIESSSLYRYFHRKLEQIRGAAAGGHFIAITDPGTILERLARERQFRRVFLNPADIGGRYSALSLFGLVPMTLIGLDPGRVLDRALVMAERCSGNDPAGNPGLRVGAAMGALASAGRNKLTFFLAPPIHSFGWWIEQLIAESTGKEGLGILPVEGEPPADPDSYSDDRLFVYLGLEGSPDPEIEARLAKLESAGFPVMRWTLIDRLDLAGEFFLWEFATAVSGAVLDINPFDQPNVKESKDITQRLIRQYHTNGSLPETRAAFAWENLEFYCAGPALAAPQNAASPRQALEAFLDLLKPNEYVALLAYVERCKEISAQLEGLRLAIRNRRRASTTTGFGPRFLHSTGQLHKGGADNGIFPQITADDAQDMEIPGEGYSFGTLKRAQALGDFEALVQRGRRVLRIHLHGDIPGGLRQLADLV